MYNSKQWPSKRELARLLLKHTYREIAEMYDTSHSVIQRLRDAYKITTLSRKIRSRLLNRTDITKWSYVTDLTKIPTYLRRSKYPTTRGFYGNKSYPIKLVRALAITLLGKIIPKFIDCHHLCGNKECVNLRHIVLVPKLVHRNYHSGKITNIPEELKLWLGTYYSGIETDCITGCIPCVVQKGISDSLWETFLTNCLLAKPILEKAAKQELEEANSEIEDLLSDDLKQAA